MISAPASSLLQYPLCEYLLVTYPHNDLQEEIVSLRKEFYQKFCIDGNFSKQAGIGLVKFKQYTGIEYRFLQSLKDIAQNTVPFPVQLQDFGSYPCHSIFINLRTKLPVQQLQQTIRSRTQSLMKLDQWNKGHFFQQPFVPLAQHLLPWQYEKAWLEYQQSSFNRRFIFNRLDVLRKAITDDQYYTIIQLSLGGKNKLQQASIQF